MKRACRSVFSLLVALVALFTISPVYALTSTEKENLYAASVDSLEAYLENQEEDAEALEELYDNFKQLKGYERSAALASYVRVLFLVANNEFDGNELSFEFEDCLLRDDVFRKYLADRENKVFGTMDDFENYIRGRIAEAKGDKTEAAEKYQKCLHYFDTKDRYSALHRSINEEHYSKGMEYYRQSEWQKAYDEFSMANGYEDSAARMKSCELKITEAKQTEETYQNAEALYQAQNWEAARIEYLKIPGYKDVDSKLAKCNSEVLAVMRENYNKVGNIVTYGHYEQDNDKSNGKEAIEWIVIKYDSESDKALLLSLYGLDALRFNARTYQGWENSEIRSWLNDDFLNEAFTAEEQKGIAITTVKTGDNEEWVTYAKNRGWGNTTVSGGKDTLDKVFLLSLEEVMEYGMGDGIYGKLAEFQSNYARFSNLISGGLNKLKAMPTDYAIARSIYHSAGSSCWWWLRSPSFGDNGASCIASDGSISSDDVSSTGNTVRPAFWLDLNAVLQ